LPSMNSRTMGPYERVVEGQHGETKRREANYVPTRGVLLQNGSCGDLTHNKSSTCIANVCSTDSTAMGRNGSRLRQAYPPAALLETPTAWVET